NTKQETDSDDSVSMDFYETSKSSNSRRTVTPNTSQKPRKRKEDNDSEKAPVSKGKKKLKKADDGGEHTAADQEKSSGTKKTGVHHYFQYLQKKTGPVAPGSKSIPVGAENCLAGLTFVFTGELESLSREEAQDLAKRYGAKVTISPSSRTSYVVVGADAGPKKLEKIEQLKIKTLTEDEFLEFIRTSPTRDNITTSKPSKSTKKAKVVENEKMLVDEPVIVSSTSNSQGPVAQLWVDKYKPQKLTELVGNQTQVTRLQKWLEQWETNLRSDFKQTDKNSLAFRAALLSGAPGVGKTTAAHLVGKLQGYDVMEFNASDTRNKKAIENAIKIATSNRSIAGYLQSETSNIKADEKGKQKEKTAPSKSNKLLIIMDEVDGMSAGDRGGIAELTSLIKKTQVPIICICNDRQSQKVKTLATICLDLKFQRPRVESVRSRILTIACRENVKIPPNVIDQLTSSARSDIRQVLNMLSTYFLSAKNIDYDQGKALSKSSEKNFVMNPWDVTAKLFSKLTWSQSSNLTMSDKLELYFNDYDIIPLMVHENYLKHSPARAQRLAQEAKSNTAMKVYAMDFFSKAADSISDGDLLDRMIRGPQQHWTLMPAHAVLSCVQPASFIYGDSIHTGGYGGPYSFPSWLGQNSKAQKHQRQLKELHSHMRMRVSGDKTEVRLSYIPTLAPGLSLPLAGEDGISKVIEKMDEYYLNREDWDSLMELGIGPNSSNKLLSSVNTKVKTAFTRKYNSTTHPVPLLGVATVSKAPTSAVVVPDIEEAYIKQKGSNVFKAASGKGAKSTRGRVI
ncbi:9572_t:CDS:10, partial [Paraglomus occultum]